MFFLLSAMRHQKAPSAKTPKRHAATPTTPRWYGYLPVLAAVLLFLTGLNNELTGLDDHTATTENPAVADFSVNTLFSQFNLGMYAPLTWLFYALAHALGGENPQWYHLLSLAVHALNTWLVFRLLERLHQPVLVAALVAFVFAVHPMQVESVSWVAAFSTPLHILFYLLTLLQYLRYTDAPDTTSGRRHYFAALGLLVLACLAKTTAVSLPLTLLVLDWWRNPQRSIARHWQGYAPFFAIALIFGLLTINSRQVSGEGIQVFETYDLLDRFLMANYALFSYAGNFVAPVRLSSFYAFDQVDGAWPIVYFIAPALVIGVLALAWLKRATWPFVAQGLGFYLSAIVLALPVLTVGTFELFADHYNYLGIIGLAFLAVRGIFFLKEKMPALSGLFSVVGGIWLVALFVVSFNQIKTWKNTLTVMSNAIEQGNTFRGKAYFWRAVEYGDLGQPDRAIEDFSRAIEVNSEIWDAYKFRGSLYAQRRDFARAVPDLQRYLENDPEDAVSWFNMGMILLEQGRPADAVPAFTSSLRVRPNAAVALENRARAYQMLGDTARAEADMQAIARMRQGN
ncbi:MAG: tetratricopeptide repeat protein [Lewinellaceae bacterium]|nr:tetratricopeptide repeat protein [Lewinellaceae bacterium]